VRARNATQNCVYAETYGAQAMAAPLKGGPFPVHQGHEIKCDFCQHELYDYG
jgi:hypothetical protein